MLSVTSRVRQHASGGTGSCRPWTGHPRQPSGGAMLGRGLVWVGGYLYSRWGLFAGTVCWFCLAGLVFLVWLAPPAGGWRRVSAARTTESPPIASPWGAAAAVPPSGTELSTA